MTSGDKEKEKEKEKIEVLKFIPWCDKYTSVYIKIRYKYEDKWFTCCTTGITEGVNIIWITFNKWLDGLLANS